MTSDLDRLLALRDDIDLSYTNEYDTLKAKIESMMYPEPHGYRIKELESQVAKLKEELRGTKIRLGDMRRLSLTQQSTLDEIKTKLKEINDDESFHDVEYCAVDWVEEILAKLESKK